MKDAYLEITFRKGRPFAAYLYLPRAPGAKSARVEQAAPGILVDYLQTGEPIGLEITAPRRVTIEAVNAVLAKLGVAQLAPEELAPLRAA